MYIPTKEEVKEILERGIKKSEEFTSKGLRKPIKTEELHTIMQYVEFSNEYSKKESGSK